MVFPTILFFFKINVLFFISLITLYYTTCMSLLPEYLKSKESFAFVSFMPQKDGGK